MGTPKNDGTGPPSGGGGAGSQWSDPAQKASLRSLIKPEKAILNHSVRNETQRIHLIILVTSATSAVISDF